MEYVRKHILLLMLCSLDSVVVLFIRWSCGSYKVELLCFVYISFPVTFVDPTTLHKHRLGAAGLTVATTSLTCTSRSRSRWTRSSDFLFQWDASIKKTIEFLDLADRDTYKQSCKCDVTTVQGSYHRQRVAKWMRTTGFLYFAINGNDIVIW